jgi:hypothetical protein
MDLCAWRPSDTLGSTALGRACGLALGLSRWVAAFEQQLGILAAHDRSSSDRPIQSDV